MNKSVQAANVKSVRAYLEGIGQPVTSVQAYEVVARALGYKSKHVLARSDKHAMPVEASAAQNIPDSVVIDGVVVPVSKPGDKIMTLEQMKAANWTFDKIYPFSLDESVGDIDRMNETASKHTTGLDYALEGIGCDHVPEINYGQGLVAYRVTGYISCPEEIFDFLADSEIEFYANLLELANRITNDAPVTVSASIGGVHEQVVLKVNDTALGLLKTYAKGQGANNDEVNQHRLDVVFECKNSDGTEGSPVRPMLLHELKYAVKVNPCTWSVSLEQHNSLLRFNG